MLEKQMSYESPTKPPPWGGFCFSVVRVVRAICFVVSYHNFVFTPVVSKLSLHIESIITL